MADPAVIAGPDALDDTLSRVSKKAGVKATMILDRATGAILKTSGQVSAIRTTKSSQSNGANGANGTSGVAGSFSSDPGAASAESVSATVASPETQGAEELAAIVWNFVGTAGGLVEELDTEDELKLLRLRTKKQELVIVPDAKYLLIVIHDTPPA